MRRTKWNVSKFPGATLSRLAVAAILLTACHSTNSVAQQRGQKTFPSAGDAANALVAAMQSHDEKAMIDILGADAKQVVYSGDDVEDKEAHANFVQRYQEMHRLVTEPNGKTTLYIGAMNWPAPIPLMNKGNSWYFDTDASKKEILYRRVGLNELSAIRVCQELVAAQKEYFSTQSNEYAQKIFSAEGQHNGLYWKASAGEPQSPIGPLVAEANAEGYTKGQDGPPTPYRGYLFHILPSQGKNQPGGAKSYLVNGKMTGGFAFVAYPAEYRSSGVMTFVVGSDGVIYQKDLGKKTETIGKALKDYNPDSTWQKPPEQEKMAEEPKNQ